jgi:ion channel
VIARLLHAYAAHRYAVMFYTLLALLVAAPGLAALGLDPRWLQAVVALNLVAVTAGLSPGALRRSVAIAVLAAIAIAGVSQSISYARGVSVALFLWSWLALIGTVSVVRFALLSPEVRGEHVYAALSVYLVVGLYLGVVYHVIATASPGAFMIDGVPTTPDTDFDVANGIYYSFATLATLGYGDIVPNTAVTRGMAVLEAVAGQLYVAVLVAKLVGSFASRGAHPRRD